MATPPQAVPQQGGPPPGGSPSAATQGPQILQFIKVIAQASQALGRLFPAAAPMVSAIQSQVQQIQSKVAETQRPTQPQAPPV